MKYCTVSPHTRAGRLGFLHAIEFRIASRDHSTLWRRVQRFERDEKDRMDSLQYSLRYWFGGTIEQVRDFIYNYAEGTTEELINQYKTWIKSLPENDLPY